MRERHTVLKPEDLAGDRLYFNDFITAVTIEAHCDGRTPFLFHMANLGEKTYAVPHITDFTQCIILNIYDKAGHFIGCGLCDEIVIIDNVIEEEEVARVE